jgi:trimeric autotransporter adhesin
VTGSGFQIGSNLFASGSYASQNSFLGFAGNSTTTGPDNTATGAIALASNTTGYYNTADGAAALFSNTTGYYNTASGMSALYFNTTGYYNTAAGWGALVQNDTGSGNTAAGYLALEFNTSGLNNTGLGAYTGTPTNGSFTTGSSNTYVGYLANPGTQPNLSNATAIGANAQVTASNAMVLGSINGVNSATASTNVGIGTTQPTYLLHIGNSGGATYNNFLRVEGPTAAGTHGMAASFGGYGDFGIDAFGNANGRFWVTESGEVGIGIAYGGAPDNLLTVNGSADKPGGGSWGTYSDRRLKTLDGNFNSGLSRILKLNPVRYRYKPDNAMGIHDSEEHVGVVAQEVQKVIPEAVTENSKGYLLVNNDPIIWAMLNAIKEQQGEFRKEQTELAKALRQIKQQQNLLRAQSAAMRTLEAEVRETRETLRKVKAQVAAAQPALVAAK